MSSRSDPPNTASKVRQKVILQPPPNSHHAQAPPLASVTSHTFRMWAQMQTCPTTCRLLLLPALAPAGENGRRLKEYLAALRVALLAGLEYGVGSVRDCALSVFACNDKAVGCFMSSSPGNPWLASVVLLRGRNWMSQLYSV